LIKPELYENVEKWLREYSDQGVSHPPGVVDRSKDSNAIIRRMEEDRERVRVSLSTDRYSKKEQERRLGLLQGLWTSPGILISSLIARGRWRSH
jgi:hypothetical protein